MPPRKRTHDDDRTTAATSGTRRRFVGAVGTLAALSLAGCLGDGGTDGDDSTSDDDDDPGDDGTDDGDDSTGDDTDDDGTGDDGTDDDGSTDGDTDDGSGDDGDAGQPTFWDHITFEEAYVFEVSTGDDRPPMSGRFDGEHMYWRAEQDGQVMELYLIEEDLYLVENGEDCIIMSPDEDNPAPEPPDETDPEAGLSEQASVERVGTDTIDGDAVVVYELTAEERDETATWYLLEDSGRPRRLEAEEVTIDWTYQDVPPVEAPDIECEELPF